MIWTSCISPTADAGSTASSGAHMNEPQRARSAIVLQSPDSPPLPPSSSSGSRSTASEYGSTKYGFAAGGVGPQVVRPSPSGATNFFSTYSRNGVPDTRATTSPSSA